MSPLGSHRLIAIPFWNGWIFLPQRSPRTQSWKAEEALGWLPYGFGRLCVSAALKSIPQGRLVLRQERKGLSF
jgi:hypothetical protein